jgi:hypothetical protein
VQEIIKELGKPMKQIDASSRTDLDQLEKVSTGGCGALVQSGC